MQRGDDSQGQLARDPVVIIARGKKPTNRSAEQDGACGAMLASATRAGTSSTTKPDHAAGAVHGAGAGAGGTPIVVTDGGQEVTVSQFVAQLDGKDTEEQSHCSPSWSSEGMKKFSNWPTVPQLYCKGELLGGCDIVIAMHDSGELKDVFEEHNIPLKPQGSKNEEAGQPESATEKGGAVAEPIGLTDAQKARLESLINSSPVMVFIKGTPEEPRCGFSGKLVHILKQENIPFSSFDILSDDEVRQGLKVLSNWPSYPQLYIKGELVGGSDIVMEMHKSGELKKVLSEKGVIPKESLEDRLKSLVSSAPVMLLMKGTPDAPRCGFSSKVVNALKKEGVSFGSFDILSDEEVRQGLKTYSNWPTFPQLYYKSELIGGCDIVLEMEKSGDLKSTLSE
ncbi:monothiol glutaredoxin-S11 isoform X3 [Zea mays]|uniref:monothiol glutaredoxin-S11 isoform X3 n=1 Tax=Zea mays TaxID=4577 RepID=UPI0009A97068|nr:monothiol glutaredoxin-S11 isoform X3 [Zea mays]|eukprot:XP_020398297.1 monothiol glutaredoxin-S11 isoform X3 [Zea mays]